MQSAANQEIVKELRKRWDYAMRAWSKIREEGAKDIMLVTDPWPQDEKQIRSQDGNRRPMLVLDEVSQFRNALINSQRQTKTAIKVDPRGDKATDKLASHRADQIRQIEYRSKAQQVYLSAFTSAVKRSYGFAKLEKRYVDDESDEQELWLVPVPNPDTILIDPDFQQPDASDIQYAFEVDRVRREEFPIKFGKDATITSFSPELIRDVPGWIDAEWVRIVKYSRIEKTKRTLLRVVDPEAGEVKLFLDELPGAKIADGFLVTEDGIKRQIVYQRPTEMRKVVQYMSNGVEVLGDPIPWDGKFIPLAVCLGEEEWIPNGVNGTSERTFKSLARNSRDAVMGHNFCATSEMELAGQVPKTPWTGYVGQFEGREASWKNAAKVPTGFLEAHAYTAEYPQENARAPLPLPQRNMYEPAIQAMEMLKESFRRSIQASMGITSLPTAAQRQNQKSGIALEKIEAQQAMGSYHFVDNFNAFKEHIGRMLNDCLKIYDTEREVGMRGPDDHHYTMRMNTDEPYLDKRTGEMVHYRVDQGEYDVSISVGPNELSAHDAAEEFSGQIASPELLAAAVQGNPRASKIVALAIRLRNGGVLMDEMADVFDPEEDQPPAEQMKMQLQQAMQKLQMAEQAIQELKIEADKNTADLKGKQIDSYTKIKTTSIQAVAGIEEALISAGAKEADRDLAMKKHAATLLSDADKLAAENEHELGLQESSQSHQEGMQAREQVNATDQAEAQRTHEAEQAEIARKEAAKAPVSE